MCRTSESPAARSAGRTFTRHLTQNHLIVAVVIVIYCCSYGSSKYFAVSSYLLEFAGSSVVIFRGFQRIRLSVEVSFPTSFENEYEQNATWKYAPCEQ